MLSRRQLDVFDLQMKSRCPQCLEKSAKFCLSEVGNSADQLTLLLSLAVCPVDPLPKVDPTNFGSEKGFSVFLGDLVARVLLVVSFKAVEGDQGDHLVVFLSRHLSQRFLGLELLWVLFK